MAYITINKEHFAHNLCVIQEHLKMINPQKNIQVGAVLKDNGYGHGLEIMSNLAQQNNITSVFVKNYEEAIKIAHKFDSVTFFYGIAHKKITNIYPTIHSFNDIFNMERIIGDLSGMGVELKVNIGMNRNGIELRDLEQYIEMILQKNMRLIGVFSHNGYGDEIDDEFQRECDLHDILKEKVRQLSRQLGFPLPRFHSLSSSCTLRAKYSDDDLVRIGIALYGYLTNEIEIESAKNLKPILKLYANKISTRVLNPAEKIGYGGKSIIHEKTAISTYDIGYGDGMYRVNGSKKVLLPNGKEILPRSSMDCFSCYDTANEICVIDDAAYIASLFDTIPYEVLTRLSPFIERRII
ncbi:alanine racemase [Helicobacter didelphidarum]|uniref:Alanine racemase n=1 Tax=Helicobacter didelphidarum TaxID=2040648 RepID=A0A3D8INP5_9HELI|nr:alanine racemase [Helicobacter didelphidarum]RDU66733.1 alanine racemase [Helicobacter didelphidarum]